MANTQGRPPVVPICPDPDAKPIESVPNPEGPSKTVEVPDNEALARKMADSLYQFIGHGDDEHRRWLREKSLEWTRSWIRSEPSKTVEIPDDE